MENLDLAWLAGIVDGEGCISISQGPYIKKKPYYSLRVTITNSDARILNKVNGLFPGYIYLLNPKTGRGKRNTTRPCYMWLLSCDKAKTFLSAILPYLVGKKDQAELGLQFTETLGNFGGSRPMPDENLEVRRQMFESIKALKVPPSMALTENK